MMEIELSGLPQYIGEQVSESVKRGQKVFDSELLRYSLAYIPHDTGDFMKRSQMVNASLAGTGTVLYPGPFARFLNSGLVMVGVDSQSAYAKAGESKVVTNTPLQFKGAPIRGAAWAERAWETHKLAIIAATQKAVDGEI